MIAQSKGLAKPSMSMHPMESPAVCLVSIEVNYLTVTSDCSCLVKRFRILRNLLLFFEFRYYPFYYYYYYYYSVFSESPFARKNLRNCNAFSHQTSHTCGPLPLIVHTIVFGRIRITVLDLEPNPCFQTFLNISKPYHRIFNCDTSKRRSGQELPFTFFELRAPTCL